MLSQTGDYAAFKFQPLPRRHLHCAIDIQKDLGKLNDERGKDQRMQFRIGINVGDVMVKDGDIFGDGVNIAARLKGLADPGGLCKRFHMPAQGKIINR